MLINVFCLAVNTDKRFYSCNCMMTDVKKHVQINTNIQLRPINVLIYLGKMLGLLNCFHCVHREIQNQDVDFCLKVIAYTQQLPHPKFSRPL